MIVNLNLKLLSDYYIGSSWYVLFFSGVCFCFLFNVGKILVV